MKKTIFTCLAILSCAFICAQNVKVLNKNGEIVDIFSANEVSKVVFDKGPSFVKLGLPSGLKWATCNIGANSPEEYGDYYAWGDTKLYYTYENGQRNWIHSFNWGSYPWGNGNDYMTKYYSKDGLTTLLPEDDVASKSLGDNWRTPTFEEWVELQTNCVWVWTTDYSGKKGYIVYKAKKDEDKGKAYIQGTWKKFSSNDRSSGSQYVACEDTPDNYTTTSDIHIFLPCAGCGRDNSIISVGSYGDYWSSSIEPTRVPNAICLAFDASKINSWNFSFYRYYGMSIRPVHP